MSDRIDTTLAMDDEPEKTEETAENAGWFLISLVGAVPGAVFPVTEAAAVIGRAETADIVIPERRVSSQHCAVQVRSGAVWVEDKGSRNGTFIGADRIQEPKRLAPGGLMVVGGTMLLLVHGTPADCLRLCRAIGPMTLHYRGLLDRPPEQKTSEEEHFRQILQMQERVRSHESQLQRGLLVDGSLRVVDAAGRWLCPWCRTAVKGVDIVSDFGLAQAGPFAMARHLAHDCAAYQQQKPRATEEELRQLARGETPEMPEAAAKESESISLHKEHLESLRGEIESLRAMVTDTQKASKESAQFKKAMEVARDRQLRMLPAIPAIEGLSIAAQYSPCDTVSGDFYDFIRVGPGVFGVLIGDVSGHGIEAALVMSMAKKALQMHGRQQLSAAQALILANADLCGELDRQTFVTALYMIFDLNQGKLSIARAGHTPAYFARAGAEPPVQAIAPAGISLGMAKTPVFSAKIEERSVSLKKGDTLLIFTDGILEAANKKDDEFGSERLMSLVESFAGREPKHLIHVIRGELETFCEGRAQQDDITMIAVKVTGEISGQCGTREGDGG